MTYQPPYGIGFLSYAELLQDDIFALFKLADMSLTATLNPSSRVLSGNPIRLDVNTDTLATYSVMVNGTERYAGSGIGSFYVYLQDVIAPYLQPAVIYNSDERYVIPLSNCSASLTVVVTNSGSSVTRTATVYFGGVSRTVLRSLGNSNIFTTRLLNGNKNFFMTTRGDDSGFTIPLSEVSPVNFIWPLSGGTPVTLTAKAGSQSVTLSAGSSADVYALNISKLLDGLSSGGARPTIIEIYAGQTRSCRIFVPDDGIARNRFYLRFLGSLGTYEIVACTGKASFGQENGEDGVFNVFDPLVDGYVQRRDRRFTRQTLQLCTGYQDEQHLLFLQDLLSSDDVTLLGYHGQNHRVIPFCDDMSVAVNSHAPGSLNILLRFVDEDAFYSPDSSFGQLGDARIHTEEFTEEFV